MIETGLWTASLRMACTRMACTVVLCGLVIADVAADSVPAIQVKSLKEIREHAVVMQRWDTSCAAAALATVLTYGFHDPVSERYIAAKMLETTEPGKVKAQGGFSLLDMKQFAQSRGYSGDAYQYLSTDDLKLFRAPIVPISVHGVNHYVVVNAVTGDQVLIADPAFGNRALSMTRFKQIWLNGIAFVVTVQSIHTP